MFSYFCLFLELIYLRLGGLVPSDVALSRMLDAIVSSGKASWYEDFRYNVFRNSRVSSNDYQISNVNVLSFNPFPNCRCRWNVLLFFHIFFTFPMSSRFLGRWKKQCLFSTVADSGSSQHHHHLQPHQRQDSVRDYQETCCICVYLCVPPASNHVFLMSHFQLQSFILISKLCSQCSHAGFAAQGDAERAMDSGRNPDELSVGGTGGQQKSWFWSSKTVA